MLGAGRYDRKIDFYAVVTARDGGGVETETWPNLTTSAFAAVTFGSGSERRDAGAAGAVQASTFRVRSTAALRAITARDQIGFDGVRWGITSIAQVGSQGHEIEFTATRIG